MDLSSVATPLKEVMSLPSLAYQLPWEVHKLFFLLWQNVVRSSLLKIFTGNNSPPEVMNAMTMSCPEKFFQSTPHHPFVLLFFPSSLWCHFLSPGVWHSRHFRVSTTALLLHSTLISSYYLKLIWWWPRTVLIYGYKHEHLSSHFTVL